MWTRLSGRRAILPLVYSIAIGACSADPPTSPTELAISSGPLNAAPVIALAPSSFHFCYPGGGSTRVCAPGGYLSIGNAGAGTLTWTAMKSSSWLRMSRRKGTAPSTVRVWADVTNLTRGRTYYAQITVTGTVANNNPQVVRVYMTMR